MIKRLIQIAFITALLWGVGFVFYVYSIQPQLKKNSATSLGIPEPKADGIVVLTGGNMRVAKGFIMLREGKAKELLISGVSKDITLQNLLDVYSANSLMADVRSNITMGYEAADTHGNAIEAYAWAAKRNYTNLIIVTAHYHMPRALMQFNKQMPKGTKYILRSEAVVPTEFEINDWWRDVSVLHLLAREYNKLLVTYVGGL